MSRKGQETSFQERKLIVRLHNQCKSSYEVAKLVGRPRSTVQSVIDRFCTTKTFRNQPRSGRPRALTVQDERFIVREIKKNPKTSAPKLAGELERRGTKVCVNTVRNVCKAYGYNGRVARKKFWVSEVNRKKRLDFANAYRFKKEDFWNDVILSDESKYNIFGSDGRRMVWRKKNTEMQPQNLVPTVKHGGGSLMVWGCMSAAGVGKLHFIEGIMDHKIYINIKENLNASAEKLGLQGKYIFQQDNDPKHTARNTKMWLLYNTPKQLHTPPQSPDLNPIEHLWKVLEDSIRKRQISNKKDTSRRMGENPILSHGELGQLHAAKAPGSHSFKGEPNKILILLIGYSKNGSNRKCEEQNDFHWLGERRGRECGPPSLRLAPHPASGSRFVHTSASGLSWNTLL